MTSDLAVDFGDGHFNAVDHRSGLAVGAAGARQAGDNSDDIRADAQTGQQKYQAGKKLFHSGLLPQAAGVFNLKAISGKGKAPDCSGAFR